MSFTSNDNLSQPFFLYRGRFQSIQLLPTIEAYTVSGSRNAPVFNLMTHNTFHIHDLSLQASGEGSGFVETRPSKPDVERHRWTVIGLLIIIIIIILLLYYNTVCTVLLAPHRSLHWSQTLGLLLSTHSLFY